MGVVYSTREYETPTIKSEDPKLTNVLMDHIFPILGKNGIKCFFLRLFKALDLNGGRLNPHDFTFCHRVD